MERQESEFNYGIEWLRTIRYGFDNVWEARKNKDGYVWIESLTGIFLELSSQMSDEEIAERLKQLKDYTEQINLLSKDYQKTGLIPKTLYWDLIDFQLFLIKVMKQSNLITKIKEDFLDSEEW